MDVLARLHTHATNTDVNLLNVIADHSITWSLTGLWIATHNPRPDFRLSTVYRAEHSIKRRRHHKRICPLCSDEPKAPPGTVLFPLPHPIPQEYFQCHINTLKAKFSKLMQKQVQ